MFYNSVDEVPEDIYLGNILNENEDDFDELPDDDDEDDKE